MKQLNVKTILIFSLVLGTSMVLMSCYGDPIIADLEVETAVSDLTGNGYDSVTVDRQGNVYVSEFGQFSGNNGDGTRVFKVTKDGNVVEFLTDLSGPLGNAIDSDGNFYVVNANNGSSGEVLKIAPDGTRELLATIDGFPSGLALDDDNNLYVTNFVAPTVHKINPDGDISIFAQDARLAGGVGVDIDRNGNIIVGNFSTADILSIDQRGEVSLVTTIPDIGSIGYITVMGNSIFATGISVHQIFRVTFNGEIEVFAGNGEAGSVDGPLLDASFVTPNGITSDRYNRTLYISEFNGTGLRKIEL